MKLSVGSVVSTRFHYPHTKFECEVYVLSKDEGKTYAIFNNYRPQFYFRTTDVTGSVELPQGTEMYPVIM